MKSLRLHELNIRPPEYATCLQCGRTVLVTQRLIPGGGSKKVLTEHSRVEPTAWSIAHLATPYERCSP